ncbi:PREDICTED: uncharacterized protein LOC109475034 [Branchiostoma belcheri]|uniref:Uncharacterized protein LOC109475034 n=1 Tax=Branchiostoma belcheri TaxID=7741 RepID=A0A6P4YNT5_BRABE|nr:PREDICTED: uncharacterized protein LOC109475034 [Branchiostoma belcheri]
MWLALVLTAAGMTIWQGSRLVKKYMSYPVQVKVGIVVNNKLIFPSVTVCNQNRLRKSRLNGSRFQPLIEIDDETIGSVDFLELQGLDEPLDGEDVAPTNAPTTSAPDTANRSRRSAHWLEMESMNRLHEKRRHMVKRKNRATSTCPTAPVSGTDIVCLDEKFLMENASEGCAQIGMQLCSYHQLRTAHARGIRDPLPLDRSDSWRFFSRPGWDVTLQNECGPRYENVVDECYDGMFPHTSRAGTEGFLYCCTKEYIVTDETFTDHQGAKQACDDQGFQLCTPQQLKKIFTDGFRGETWGFVSDPTKKAHLSPCGCRPKKMCYQLTYGYVPRTNRNMPAYCCQQTYALLEVDSPQQNRAEETCSSKNFHLCPIQRLVDVHKAGIQSDRWGWVKHPGRIALLGKPCDDLQSNDTECYQQRVTHLDDQTSSNLSHCCSPMIAISNDRFQDEEDASNSCDRQGLQLCTLPQLVTGYRRGTPSDDYGWARDGTYQGIVTKCSSDANCSNARTVRPGDSFPAYCCQYVEVKITIPPRTQCTNMIRGCSEPLGMEDGRISNHQITASSTMGRNGTLPYQGRLNGWGAWWADVISDSNLGSNEWFQVDLLKPTYVTGLMTQGVRGGLIITYKLFYSNDSHGPWMVYRDKSSNREELFKGVTRVGETSHQHFAYPILTRYVRLKPHFLSNKYATLRMELVGCDPETCADPRSTDARGVVDVSLDCQGRDCYVGNGENYRGTKRTTESGRGCQQWTRHDPHPHCNITSDTYPGACLVLDYCRNPDGRPGGPWCFTKDPDVPWEPCGVGKCTLHENEVLDKAAWRGYIEKSNTSDNSDLSEILPPATRQELRQLGHQRNDFILQCSFDKQPCSPEDFITSQNAKYGNCFTFNSGHNGVVRTTTRSGTSYGLKLTLNAESAEYLGLFGQRVGARVTLHPVNSTAFPDTEGIDAPPGTASSVSVRQVVITRTPWPYGQTDCTSNDDDYGSLYSGKIYTLRMCENTCLQCAIINRCRCATDMIDLTRKKAISECSPLFHNSTVPVCNIAKSRVQACVRGLWKRFQRGELDCKCNQACRDETFDLSLSSSKWPSNQFVPYILRDLHMIQDVRRNNLPRNMKEVKDNLVRVEISYKELNYESISEEWNYKEENLLGDMGGLLGFYIGVSIITICEFVDYVLDLFGLLCRKIKRSLKRKNVHPIKLGPDVKADKKGPRKIFVIPVATNKNEKEEMARNLTIPQLSKKFCSATTCHGLNRIAQAQSPVARFIWLSLVLTSLTLFVLQANLLITKYLAYPVQINVNIVVNHKLPFPSVTICNQNRMKKSTLNGTRFAPLADIDEETVGTVAYLGKDASTVSRQRGGSSEYTGRKKREIPAEDPHSLRGDRPVVVRKRRASLSSPGCPSDPGNPYGIVCLDVKFSMVNATKGCAAIGMQLCTYDQLRKAHAMGVRDPLTSDDNDGWRFFSRPDWDVTLQDDCGPRYEKVVDECYEGMFPHTPRPATHGFLYCCTREMVRTTEEYNTHEEAKQACENQQFQLCTLKQMTNAYDNGIRDENWGFISPSDKQAQLAPCGCRPDNECYQLAFSYIQRQSTTLPAYCCKRTYQMRNDYFGQEGAERGCSSIGYELCSLKQLAAVHDMGSRSVAWGWVKEERTISRLHGICAEGNGVHCYEQALQYTTATPGGLYGLHCCTPTFLATTQSFISYDNAAGTCSRDGKQICTLAQLAEEYQNGVQTNTWGWAEGQMQAVVGECDSTLDCFNNVTNAIPYVTADGSAKQAYCCEYVRVWPELPPRTQCTNRFKGCNNPLGMENGVIKDYQITASSTDGRNGTQAHYGRLNGWAAWWSNGVPQGVLGIDEWFQVDLLKPMYVTGIITQGLARAFILTFKIRYSNDTGGPWFVYTDPYGGRDELFKGVSAEDQTSHQHFAFPILARYIRFMPWFLSEFISLKMELVGCDPETCSDPKSTDGRGVVNVALDCQERECYMGKGENYRGIKKTTESGRSCQNWDRHYPHQHCNITGDTYSGACLAKNYCRNPDGRPGGPWCFTVDPVITWEYCGVEKCTEGDDIVLDKTAWREYIERTNTSDYNDLSDLLPRATRDELRQLGHQRDDFILQCSFDKQPCTPEDFTSTQTERYGNCFTFNSGRDGKEWVTTRSGSSYGLKLTLNLETAEYLGLFGNKAGARVSIHPVNSTPFPDTDGVDIPPGMATSISVRSLVITRTPFPYGGGDCTANVDETVSLYEGNKYSFRLCENSCYQCQVMQNCSCTTDLIDLSKVEAIRKCNDRFRDAPVPICDLANPRVQACVRSQWKRFESGEMNCTCNQACRDDAYELSISSAVWPSRQFQPYILRDLHMIQHLNRRNLPRSYEDVRDNLVRVEVYYEELNYQSISEEWNYKEEDFLSDLGGLLGLYIGISFITLCEIIDFLLDMIKLLMKKCLVLRMKWQWRQLQQAVDESKVNG